MQANYLNRYGVVCGTGTDHRMLPEAELWTRVILQAIADLHGRRSSTSSSAQDSARQWFASQSDAVGSFYLDLQCHRCRSKISSAHVRQEALDEEPRRDCNDIQKTRSKTSTEKGFQIFAVQSHLRPNFKRAAGQP
jgi:hypothetical protein